MPKTAKKKYYHYLMDIAFDNGITYDDICDVYDHEKITVDGLKKSRNLSRGNLPRGTTADQFYEKVLENFRYDNPQYACQLNRLLNRDGVFPEEWRNEENKISGFDKEHFDKESFRSFVIYLLNLDKKTKKKGNQSKTQKNMDAVNFSFKFLHSAAKQFVEAKEIDYPAEFEKLSLVFDKIASFEYTVAGKKIKYTGENVIGSVYDHLCDQLTSSTDELLKIKGPVGSYKNRILQYLYLAINEKRRDVIPFYMDFAFYEKNEERDRVVTNDDIINEFQRDIQELDAILSAHSGKQPVLFIDGLRDFFYYPETFFYKVKEEIKSRNLKLVICEDTDFTINDMQKYHIHPIASDEYSMVLRVRSMNLIQRTESIEFIRDCIHVFSPRDLSDVSPETIYDCLVRLNFREIDAYWLIYILRTSLNIILRKKNTIASLYESICLEFLGKYDSILSISELAYHFEFGNLGQDFKIKGFDFYWKLLRKHRSILDYLIARRYVNKLAELDFQHGSREQHIKDLSFFNMVMQKNITRFVVAMIQGVDDYEHQIMIIASEYYDSLSLFGKSELTFLMARLKNSKRKSECIKLLHSYNQKELSDYLAMDPSCNTEKRDAAFRICGINVSLIYEKDREALEYYLNALLTDKLFNSVNRGFHLEYYGDKPYIPNKTLLDFEDDITKGKATLTVLCLSLDNSMEKNEVNSYIALLNLLTMCSLIQARTEYHEEVTPLDVSPYILRCIKYLEWILPQRILRELTEVFMYFRFMHTELSSIVNRTEQGKFIYKHSSVMNRFTKANCVDRERWVDMEIDDPENIVEHMYKCWLIGMLYLPDHVDIKGYDKDAILKMLLIHDLGKTETGDSGASQRREIRESYDRQEGIVMQSLLLSGTYPGAVDLHEYLDQWNSWEQKESINYLVAKDIDTIQTIYQFCQYCLERKEISTSDHVRYWLNGLQNMETEIGKSIAETVIWQNDIFRDLIEGYINE